MYLPQISCVRQLIKQNIQGQMAELHLRNAEMSVLMSIRTLSVWLVECKLFMVRTSQTRQYTLSPKCAVFLWKSLVRKWPSCCRQTLQCDVETPGPGTAVETTRTVSDYCYYTSDGFSVGREVEATSPNLTKYKTHFASISFVNEIRVIKKR